MSDGKEKQFLVLTPCGPSYFLIQNDDNEKEFTENSSSSL